MRVGWSIFALLIGCYPTQALPPLDFLDAEDKTAMVILNDEEHFLFELPLDLTLTFAEDEPPLAIVVFDRSADDLGLHLGRQHAQQGNGRIPMAGARAFRVANDDWEDAPAVLQNLSLRWFRPDPVRLHCQDFSWETVRLASNVRAPVLTTRRITYVTNQGALVEDDGVPLELGFEPIGGVPWFGETLLIGRDGQLHSGSHSSGSFTSFGFETQALETLLGWTAHFLYAADGDGRIFQTVPTSTASPFWVEVAASDVAMGRPQAYWDLAFHTTSCRAARTCQLGQYDVVIARGDDEPLQLWAGEPHVSLGPFEPGETIDAVEAIASLALQTSIYVAVWDGQTTRFVDHLGKTVERLEQERVIDFRLVQGVFLVSTEARGTGFIAGERFCELGLPPGTWNPQGPHPWLWTQNEVYLVQVAPSFSDIRCERATVDCLP